MLSRSAVFIYLLNIFVTTAVIVTLAIMQLTVVLDISAADLRMRMLILPLTVGVLGGTYLANLYLNYQQQILFCRKLLDPGVEQQSTPVVSREIQQALERAAGLDSHWSRLLTYVFYVLASIVVVYGFASTQMIAALGLSIQELSLAMYVVPTLVGGLFGYLIARNRILGQDLFRNIRAIQQQEKQLEQEIIERRNVESVLRKRGRELQVANQELDAFSHTVSHDLRAPLRSICNFSQIILEDYSTSLDATAQDYLQRIVNASLRMNDLMEGLISLSRIRHGSLAMETVDLSQLAEETLCELREHDPHRTVECHIPAGIIVNGDPKMLRSVMVNLLGNAWKYTQNRAVARIEMGIDRQNGREVYFIRDNGAGFNPSQAEKIFQPFQRVHHDISFQGNGIGLATVQRIVELHQGRIWAESGEGKGAVFYFILGPGDLAPNA